MDAITGQLGAIIESVASSLDPIRSCKNGAECIIEAFERTGMITSAYYSDEEKERFCNGEPVKLSFKVSFSAKDHLENSLWRMLHWSMTQIVFQLVPHSTAYTCEMIGYPNWAKNVIYYLLQIFVVSMSYTFSSIEAPRFAGFAVVDRYKDKIKTILEDAGDVDIKVEPDGIYGAAKAIIITLTRRRQPGVVLEEDDRDFPSLLKM